MKPTPFCWVPSSARARLQGELDRLIADWSEGWGLRARIGESVIRLTEPRDWNCRGDSHWLALNAAAGPWICVSDRFAPQLATALFGEHDAPSAIAPAIAQRATTQLLDAFKAHLQPSANRVAPVKGTDDPVRGHEGLRYDCEVAGVAVSVVASTSWLQERGWISRPRMPAIAAGAVEAALAALPVCVEIEVGTAALSIGDLRSLVPGDVVLSTTRTAAPVRLRVNSDASLPVLLGRANERRAIRTVSTPKN